MSVAYKLPAVLDFRAAAPLRESLVAQRGQPLTLDAADVVTAPHLGVRSHD